MLSAGTSRPAQTPASPNRTVRTLQQQQTVVRVRTLPCLCTDRVASRHSAAQRASIHKPPAVFKCLGILIYLKSWQLMPYMACLVHQ